MDISHYRPDAVLASRPNARTEVATYSAPTPAQLAAAGQTQPPEEGFSLFDTVLDTINPLQHVPGVSSAYQSITGDQSSAIANMAGGFLFGGPVGLAAGAANSFLEFLTGNDIMGHAMAFLNGEDAPPAAGKNGQGVDHIATAAVQHKDGLFREQNNLGLQHYQSFATAQAEQNQGTGAAQQDVSWSSNIWTSHALKEATSMYNHNQDLSKEPNRHVDPRTYDLA